MTELQTPMRIETEVKLPKERNQNLNLSKSASTPSNISSATINTDEPLEMDNQPTESVSGEQPTAKQGKMTSIKLEKNQMSDMLAPLSSMWHRATEAATSVSGTIHPVMPDLNNVKENIKATLNQPPTEGGALSDNPNPETLKKQATSLYALTLVPALMTFYRVLGGNGGPTWFSLHPVFMMISILSMLTGLLLQRYGGQKNITLIGTLTVASIVSMCLSLFAVWSAKETYAKVHFLSMHSHFGGMTIGGLLAYVIGVWYCFDPITGTERADRKWQQYLVTLGKGTATLAMCSQLAGVIEVEQTWTFLFLWMGTLLMLTPFVVLPWNK